MSTLKAAEEALRAGNPDQALTDLQNAIRADPANPKLRTFLFQLLSVQGRWERAASQLEVVGELDAAALPMVQMYREALRCEVVRSKVMAGKSAPLLFGHPEEWIALLIEACLSEGQGKADEGARLREKAFELAPASHGTINDQPFEWIADGDMRLGPVLEAVINGKYYWLPFTRLNRILIEPPEDLRDFVWMPAQFEFANGGEMVGIIPTRYPGSESADDHLIRMARKTDWIDVGHDNYHGLGQRILTTDQGDVPLLEVREIVIEGDDAPDEAEATDSPA
ncbi:MAG: tetratricopeptide repeat protein [Rhodocyclaceae bacterium]|nr:tetratricopeptide repeat protein [Rhodocyclaceae bacterium]